jgi:hypothetical protein
MRSTLNFLIESDGATHALILDGQTIADFPTLEAAKAAANGIASGAAPGASLRFELDFKSTLSDLEIRAARLDLESEESISLQ